MNSQVANQFSFLQKKVLHSQVFKSCRSIPSSPYRKQRTRIVDYESTISDHHLVPEQNICAVRKNRLDSCDFPRPNFPLFDQNYSNQNLDLLRSKRISPFLDQFHHIQIQVLCLQIH